jgi:hypothetical protein
MLSGAGTLAATARMLEDRNNEALLNKGKDATAAKT